MLIVEVPQQDHVGQEPPEALGNESFSCLSEAHITAGRVVLLFCYAILHGCIVVQENPGDSIRCRHPQGIMRERVARISEVSTWLFICRFKSMKRIRLWSNSSRISQGLQR